MKFLFITASILIPTTSFAQTSLLNVNNPLNPNPGNEINRALNNIFFLVLALAIILAVFGIIRAGYTFMVSGDNAGKREDAKNRVVASVGGLLLALGAVLLLTTINPQIVQFNLFGQSMHINLPNQAPERRPDIYDDAREAVEEKLTKEGIIDARDAFLAFRNGDLYHQVQFIDLDENDWAEILEKSDPDEAREFILRILEEDEFNPNNTNHHMSNAVLKIERAREDLLLESKILFESRKTVGFYYETQHGSIRLRDAQSPVTEESFSQNLVQHSNLFRFNNEEGILALHEASNLNDYNSYSTSIVNVLNNPGEADIDEIRAWVDQNGSQIGIVSGDNGYSLAD